MNFCPSCGAPQAFGANFCVGCGFKLDSLKVPPPDNASAPNQPSSSGYDTRSIGQTLADQVAIADQNAANALSGLNDSDAQFSACMLSKGFRVPTGLVPKLKASLPDLLDHEIGKKRDQGIQGLVEAAIGTIDPFLLALAEAAGDASEVYDHAAFAYAAIDCAARIYAGEQFSAPEPVTPPAVPVLPPPPPNWQPQVIPMQDTSPPAFWQPTADPAPPITPVANTGWSAGQAIAFILVMIPLVIGAIWIGDNYFWGGGSGSSYYFHWTCGNVAACSQTTGRESSVGGPDATLAACQAHRATVGMQAYNGNIGWWCDQHSSNETAP